MPIPIAPANPLAVHIGNGIIQILILPIPANAIGFEVVFSEVEAGPYYGFSNNSFNGHTGYVYNFPLGKTVYIKVRSISINNVFSAWVKAKRGIASKPTVEMECKAVVGSIIPAEAIFTMNRNHRIIAFATTEEIEF